MKYGYLAQKDESICNYCYGKLRVELSKGNKVVVQNQSIPSSSKENDPSTLAWTKNFWKLSFDEKERSNIPESQKYSQTLSSSSSQIDSGSS